MVLVCPSCTSTHHIARAVAGDSVGAFRCAQCSDVWLEPTAAHERDPAGERGLINERGSINGRDLAVEARSTRTDDWPFDRRPANENGAPEFDLRWGRQRWTGWLRDVAVFAMIGAVPMAAVAQREAVVDLVPATAAVYAAIGLPVNLRGLELRTVQSTLVAGERGGPVLAVAGEVANLRPLVQAAPSVRVALRGSDGREIYTWTTVLAKSRLDAHETIAFRTRLADPPPEAREVVVQFADAAGADAGMKKDDR